MGYNRHPDEKGTERTMSERILKGFICYNRYPDEKGTERLQTLIGGTHKMKKWKWKHINRKGFFGTRRFVKRQGIVNAETLGSAKRQAAKAVREQDRNNEWRGRWYDENGRVAHV